MDMKRIFFLLLVDFIMGACSKSSFLTSLQTNPNAAGTNVATPQLILPGTITGITDVINSGTIYSSLAVWEGYWNGQPGGQEISDVFNYVMTPPGGPQCWDNYYGVLTNLNVLVQISQDPANSNYRDIANILEAICFRNLVDFYNDVPYSQALKASGNFYPSYDHGSDIYDSLTAKLDAAIADIQANLNNAAAVLPTADDVMFGGNMQNWLLFANTVKLRMLVNESNVTAKQSYIATEIGNTASYGYITSDVLVNPGYNTSQPAGIWANFGLGPTGGLGGGALQLGANQTAIDFYSAGQDFRLPYFYSPNGITPISPDFFTITLPPDFSNFAANYCGTQTGIPGGSSDIGPGIAQKPGQSAVMMTAAESFFVQAEATVRGWLPGGNAAAQILYQNGITKSYEYLNVGGNKSAADGFASDYFGQDIPYVAFPTGAGADSLIHTIITQKWAALNSISILEGYNDWRRTFNEEMESGYPIVPVSNSPKNQHLHMPFRYYYPPEEQTSNHAAWVSAGGASVDPFTSKIFWMQ
jgi:hypothetical protein